MSKRGQKQLSKAQVEHKGFTVKAKQCSTCIYRADSPLDLEQLESAVADKYGGFSGFRICHSESGPTACCRGFWERHKNKFAAGQISQRLNLVVFVK